MNWCRENGVNLLQKDKDLESTIISTFKTIRDIPFETNLANQDFNKQLLSIMKEKRSSCSGKHYFLGLICEILEIKVEYLTYQFYWHKLSIKYPASIKKLAKKMPLTYHLAIRIHIDGSKFLLDATWDPPLKKAGFPINEIEDKLKNSQLAVESTEKPIIHESALERYHYLESRKINSNIKVNC